MARMLSVAEVSSIYGVAPHTLRYYEKQFPKTLVVQRTSGGHRQYGQEQLAALEKIVHLIKTEHLSINETRFRLGEEEINSDSASKAKESVQCESYLKLALQEVMTKLDDLCSQNSRIDCLLEALLEEKSGSGREELLKQLANCRKKAAKMLHLHEIIPGQGSTFPSFEPGS